LIFWTLALGSLFLATIPFLMVLANQRLFVPPDLLATKARTQLGPVSVLIPARDEAGGIAATLQAAVADRELPAEVIVLDDQSTDDTAAIVRGEAIRDPRIRLESGIPLPPQWNGKQHACWQLAQRSCGEWLVFMDADVRLRAGGLERLVGWIAARPDMGLVSAFPHQVTGSWLEKLIIPLMHFVLLGFLPLGRARASLQPAYAAGCGQLFVARRSAYEEVKGHQTIRGSRHDGVTLPRAFRAAGWMTDVLDGTDVADCRMYHSASQVVRGVLKNADEGLAHPARIVPFTLILFGGQVLPWLLLAAVWLSPTQVDRSAIVTCAVAAAIGLITRGLLAVRYRQPWLGVVLHPASLLLFLFWQWQALWNLVWGRKVAWRGRL
jgi:hypothetical protein